VTHYFYEAILILYNSPANIPESEPQFDNCDHVEYFMRGLEFVDREELLHAIEAILRELEKVILENFFLSWMERLRQYGVAVKYVE
jgi:hypothetical protein